jgi:hypothetical protein
MDYATLPRCPEHADSGHRSATDMPTRILAPAFGQLQR